MKGSGDHGTGDVLVRATERVLAPLVRLLIAHGVSFPAFADLSRRMFVTVAARAFPIARRKQSASRVSALTGVPRKEVARILQQGPASDAPVPHYNRVAQVMAGWLCDRHFADRRGRPASLPFEGEGRTFSALVRKYGSDVPPRAILDELARVHAVTRLRDGRIRLVVRAYVPTDVQGDQITMLGTDVADLIECIVHNISSESGERFFQRKVAYDNVPAEAAGSLRVRLRASGEDFVDRVNRDVASRDRDMRGSVLGPGRRRVVVGVYYFDEEVPDGEESEE